MDNLVLQRTISAGAGNVFTSGLSRFGFLVWLATPISCSSSSSPEPRPQSVTVDEACEPTRRRSAQGWRHARRFWLRSSAPSSPLALAKCNSTWRASTPRAPREPASTPTTRTPAPGPISRVAPSSTGGPRRQFECTDALEWGRRRVNGAAPRPRAMGGPLQSRRTHPAGPRGPRRARDLRAATPSLRPRR